MNAAQRRRERRIEQERLERQALLQRTSPTTTKAQILAKQQTDPPPLLLPKIEFDFSSITDAWAQQMVQSFNMPRWTFAPSTPTWMGLIERAPAIDAATLEALKSATPYKPQPKMRVPDLIECITGWRGWALSKSGRLEALGQSTVWPAKEALTATCEASGGHFAPHWTCSCGIWAFKDVDRLVAAIGSGYAAVKVIGSVSLWGKVIETENGFRAEKAYPKELWLLDDSLEELGLIYDIPVRMVKHSG